MSLTIYKVSVMNIEKHEENHRLESSTAELFSEHEFFWRNVYL